MKKRFFILAAILAAVTVAALPGCSTNTQGDSASPVFLVGSFTAPPLNACVNSLLPLPFTLPTTTVQVRLKNPAVTSLQFLDVQVEKYTIVWRRIDGGTKASPTQDFAGGFLVPPNGSTTLSDYPYMSFSNRTQPPLDQLLPFNGGIDKETGRTEIHETGSVTWYGHTLSGQPVVSNVATFEMTFIYCASPAGRIEPTRAQ
jgi:hypothetical protein